jgi:hypothetical protein
MSRLTRKSLRPLTTTARQHPLEESRVAELERQVASMQAQLDALRQLVNLRTVTGIQDDIKGIKGDLSGFGRAIRSIEQRVKALELRPSPLRRVEERRSSKTGPLSGE